MRSIGAPRARARPDASFTLGPHGIRAQLRLMERIAAGEVEVGPIGGMDQSERFHWLTTPRSTLVQPGPIHTGVTADPAATFEHLFGVLVAR